MRRKKHVFCFMWFCKIHPLLLSALLACCGCFPVVADEVLYEEDFQEGYAEGFLGGQNGWKGTRLQVTPVVTQRDGVWGLAPLKTGVDHQAELVTDGFKLRPDDVLVLDMIVRPDPEFAYGLNFGVGVAVARQPTAYIGLSHKGAHVRGATYAGEQSFAISEDGTPFTSDADRVWVRSEWSLAQGIARVFVKPLDGTDRPFELAYFDQAQRESTAPLGETGDATEWAEVFIRMGGSSDCFIESIKVSRKTK